MKLVSFLLQNGYIRYVFDGKTLKFRKADDNDYLSSVGIIDFRYIHKDNKRFLEKIKEGKSVMEEDFTFEDRKGEIVIGLHECYKPVTLISPRPRIKVKRERFINGKYYINEETEWWDDNMNLVLKEIPVEEIYKAMYDRSIVLKFDLTKK